MDPHQSCCDSSEKYVPCGDALLMKTESKQVADLKTFFGNVADDQGDIQAKVAKVPSKKLTGMEEYRLGYLPPQPKVFRSSQLPKHLENNELLLHKSVYYNDQWIYETMLMIENIYPQETISYYCVPSNDSKMSTSGIIRPGKFAKIVVRSIPKSKKSSFHELKDEFIDVYITPCQIIPWYEVQRTKKSKESEPNLAIENWAGITQEHIDDLWKHFPSPWFPQAEHHQLKILPGDPNYFHEESTGSSVMKSIWNRIKNIKLMELAKLQTEIEPELLELLRKAKIIGTFSKVNPDKTSQMIPSPRSCSKGKMLKFIGCCLLIWWICVIMDFHK